MHRHVCHNVLFSLLWSTALAAPPHELSRRQQNGGNAGQSTGIGPAIWVPLVVIGVLFAGGVLIGCSKDSWRRRMLHGTAAAADPTSREVTADQLAGQTLTAEAARPTTARRPRRTRRTPSQISTRSLPAYMKEPGEQEIVIIRGADDMEDEPAIRVEMPPVDESRESLDMSTEEREREHLHVQRDGMPSRASSNTMHSRNSTMDSSADIPHPPYTDMAPAYETIHLDDHPSTEPLTGGLPSSSPESHQQREASSATATDAADGRRRSTFMSIFGNRNSRLGSASQRELSASGHVREDSGPSMVSSDGHRSSRFFHRPSQSSGSVLSLLSRTRSNGLGSNHGHELLTSPSMISLNSISAPLTHTATRSDFTFPKTGPTPEQLKLISSRESFAKFGVPYGAAAVAFAASSSRVELPPPGFDEAVSSSPSRLGLHSMVNEEDTAQASSSPAPATSPSNPSPEAAGIDGLPITESPVEMTVSAPLQPSTSTQSQPEDDEKADEASPSASPAPAKPLDPPVPLLPPPTPSYAAPPPARLPPSAFKSNFGNGPVRSESRASSFMSFATAQESLAGGSEPPTPNRPYSPSSSPNSEPGTPRMGPRLDMHALESTDTTITPGN